MADNEPILPKIITPDEAVKLRHFIEKPSEVSGIQVGSIRVETIDLARQILEQAIVNDSSTKVSVRISGDSSVGKVTVREKATSLEDLGIVPPVVPTPVVLPPTTTPHESSGDVTVIGGKVVQGTLPPGVTISTGDRGSSVRISNTTVPGNISVIGSTGTGSNAATSKPAAAAPRPAPSAAPSQRLEMQSGAVLRENVKIDEAWMTTFIDELRSQQPSPTAVEFRNCILPMPLLVQFANAGIVSTITVVSSATSGISIKPPQGWGMNMSMKNGAMRLTLTRK